MTSLLVLATKRPRSPLIFCNGCRPLCLNLRRLVLRRISSLRLVISNHSYAHKNLIVIQALPYRTTWITVLGTFAPTLLVLLPLCWPSPESPTLSFRDSFPSLSRVIRLDAVKFVTSLSKSLLRFLHAIRRQELAIRKRNALLSGTLPQLSLNSEIPMTRAPTLQHLARLVVKDPKRWFSRLAQRNLNSLLHDRWLSRLMQLHRRSMLRGRSSQNACNGRHHFQPCDRNRQLTRRQLFHHLLFLASPVRHRLSSLGTPDRRQPRYTGPSILYLLTTQHCQH